MSRIGSFKHLVRKKNVSRMGSFKHLDRKDKKLWCEKGLLAKPDAKKGQQIPQNVKDKELEFYHLDDFTTISDKISGKNLENQFF